MKKQDLAVAAVVAVLLLACALTPDFLGRFIALTKAYPYLSSFVKFAILATFGECIGLRITAGVYNRKGFGILPRALVWGILGMGCKLSFTIYSAGAAAFLPEIGLVSGPTAFTGFGGKLLLAFATSLTVNFMYAPVFMIMHKITDIHIEKTGGTLRGFLRPIDMAGNLSVINWQSLWGIVLKKLLPFFWVPAHTITFMLPPYYQVIFAAALGIVLGVTLAWAGMKKTD